MVKIDNPFPTLVSIIREQLESLNISDRDRKAIVLGGVGAIVLITVIIFQSFSSMNGRLERQYKALESQLEQMRELGAEYYESRRRASEIADSMESTDQSLLSLIERILVRQNIERASFSINSRALVTGESYEEISVEVRIQKLSLDKVIDVIHNIQSAPTFLKVSKFRMSSRFDNPDLMDVSFRVSNFKFEQVIR